MFRENMRAIENLYMPAKDKKAMKWVAYSSEDDCWWYLKDFTAYGLEREYTYSKAELKKQGYSVKKYKLVEVE